MELRELRYFVCLAEELDLARAADRLGLAHSELRSHIGNLEESLGCSLFRRHREALTVSAAGKVFYSQARELLASAPTANGDEAGARPQARAKCIRVGHYGLWWKERYAPALRRFHRCHPELRLQPVEMLPAELPEALTRGELDLALLEQVDVPLRIAMKVRHIEAIRCCVVLLSTHPLAKRRSLGLEDLARETWLSWDPARFPGRRERLLETAMTLGLRPCIAMEVENEETLFEQVTLGNGIGYLGHRSEGLPEGLVQVPLVHAGLEFPVFIAWRKDADQIAKLEALARELLGRDG